MQIYQMKGRDCFFYILRKWPKIIAVTILTAIVFGAVTGLKTQKTWNQKKADVDAVNEQRASLVSAYEIARDNFDTDIANKEAELDEYMQKLNEADFLRYDEATVGMASADLFFISYDEDGELREIPDGICDVFANALQGGIDWERVAESGSADVDFLDQLFSVSVNPSNNRLLTIKIYAENELSASIMIDAILEQAEGIRASLDAQIGGVEYSVVSRASAENRYAEFLDIKSRVQNHYNEIAINLQSLYDGKAALEVPPEEMTMPTRNQIVKSIVKHTAFGGATGFAGMIVIFYVLYYFNGRLHSTDELSYYTGTTAMAYEAIASKRSLKLLNRFIAKKENNDLLYSQKDALLRTISNIKNQYPDVSKVMFTGIRSGAEVASIKKTLEDAKGLGLVFGIEKNILTNKEAFDHLGYYDAVVLVERIDKTSVELIRKEIDQIKIAGKEIVGSLSVR